MAIDWATGSNCVEFSAVVQRRVGGPEAIDRVIVAVEPLSGDLVHRIIDTLRRPTQRDPGIVDAAALCCGWAVPELPQNPVELLASHDRCDKLPTACSSSRLSRLWPRGPPKPRLTMAGPGVYVSR